MAANNSNKNTCLVLGGGCGCILFLLALVVAGTVFWGVQAAKQMGQELEDPVARTQRAREILGAEELPPGYHAILGLEIPWVMRFVLLSDGEIEDGAGIEVVIEEHGEAPTEESAEPARTMPPVEALPTNLPRADGEHTFLFFEFLAAARLGLNAEKQRLIEDFFAGTSDDLSPLREADIQIDLDEVLSRGSMSAAGTEVQYVVGRGDVGEIDRNDALHALFLLDCDGDPNIRLAIWSGPDAETIEASDQPDFAGTVGDPSEMEALLAYFDPCP